MQKGKIHYGLNWISYIHHMHRLLSLSGAKWSALIPLGDPTKKALLEKLMLSSVLLSSILSPTIHTGLQRNVWGWQPEIIACVCESGNTSIPRSTYWAQLFLLQSILTKEITKDSLGDLQKSPVNFGTSMGILAPDLRFYPTKPRHEQDAGEPQCFSSTLICSWWLLCYYISTTVLISHHLQLLSYKHPCRKHRASWLTYGPVMNFAFELVTLAPIQFYPKGEGGWVWEVIIGKNKIINSQDSYLIYWMI